MNTELARTIIDKFPLMRESAAALIRAGDAAGMPARQPRVVEEKEDEEDDEEDEDEECAPQRSLILDDPLTRETGVSSQEDDRLVDVPGSYLSTVT